MKLLVEIGGNWWKLVEIGGNWWKLMKPVVKIDRKLVENGEK